MSDGFRVSRPTIVPAALPPNGPAGGELTGTYPNPTVVASHSGSTHLAIGTSGTTAAAGNDSRLSDARTPTAHASSHQSGSDKVATGTPDGTKFLRDDFAWVAPTATAAVLVGPKNLVSTVELIAANTYVHVGRQLEIAATGSIEIPATSTLEITA